MHALLSTFITVNIQLGWDRKVIIVNLIVLVAIDMAHLGVGKLFKKCYSCTQEFSFSIACDYRWV